MSATQLIVDLRRRGVQLSLRDGRVHVQAPAGALTEDLRARLSGSRDELAALLALNDGAPAEAIARLPDRAETRLSPAQERLWLLQQIEADPSLYLIATALELVGELDVAAVQRSVAALIQRHEALRTVFHERDGEVRAVLLQQWPEAFAFVPVAGTAELAARLGAACAQGIALDSGPMLRVQLFRLDAQRHVLLLALHHIAGDAQSMAVLTGEFVQGYAAHAAGTVPDWAPLPLHYADYAAWQRERWSAGAGDAALAWWREQLEGLAPIHALPLDHARPEQLDNAGARHALTLDAGVRQALAQLAQAQDTTMFVVIQAAFALLLKRHGDEADVAFATVVAGRERVELAPLVGFFVNTLALRHRVDETLTVETWLARTKAVTLAAFAHQQVPFDKVIEAVSPARSLSHAPLLQLMLSYQRRRESAHSGLAGLQLRPWPLPQAGSKFELSLDVSDGDDALELCFEFNTRLFDAARIAGMAAQLGVLLQQMCAAPQAPLHTLDMLQPDQRALLRRWEGEVTAHGERAALALIVEQAGRAPAASALVDDSGSTSYAELLANVARRAAGLAARGVRAGDCVALRLPRSRAAIECMLACHWLGAAYLPVDTQLPPERAAFLCSDSGSRLLVADSALDGIVHSAPESLLLDDAAIPPADVGVANPAYVIYTSGSTGRPKGVRISQRNLASYAVAAAQAYGIDAGQRVLQFSTLAFDISVEEIFCTLTRGATLVLRDDQAVSGAAGFAACVARHRVGVVSLPTAFWHLLCDDLAAAMPADSPLHTVVIGGEAMRADRLRAWQSHVGRRIRLFNGYGPTEATVAASLCEATCATEVTIGRPYANTRCLVLQGLLRVPAGVAGELVLAGAGVGDGYIGHAAATASGYDEYAGERVYRTGDRALWRDGELIYLGRRDQQVKVQGFRVEPAEVEPFLRALDGVDDACVVCLKDAHGDNRLVAYWRGEAALHDDVSLRAALAQQLPFYLLPTRFVHVENWPLTVSGKLDRRALPPPDWHAAVADEQQLDEAELALLALFREVLAQPQFGPDDDFFRAGGHSLAAARLAGLMRSRLGRTVELRQLFAAPNVRALAALSAQTLPAIEPAPLAADGRLPLSAAQRRLWFLQQLDTHSASYNMPGAWRLRGELDVAALRQAFAAVLARHAVLRARIVEERGEPVLRIDAQAELPWREHDLRGQADAGADVEARIAANAKTPFDLARDLPLRLALLRTHDDEYVLLACLHHVAADGASLAVLLQEVHALYALASEATAPATTLPPLPLRYADYAHWQQRTLAQREDELVDYWRERLRGAPSVHALALDGVRGERPDWHGANHAFHVPATQVAQLDALAAACGVTPFLLYKSAFAVLLARFSDRDEIVLGTPTTGRERSEFGPLVGFFANTLVLRERIDRHIGLPQHLRATRAQQLADLAHQSLPFDTLVERLGLAGQGMHTPLFQILFALHESATPFALPGLAATTLDSSTATAKFDLSLHLTRTDGGIAGNIEYATALFGVATIASIARSFATLLAHLAATPDTPVGELALLPRDGEADESDPIRSLLQPVPAAIADTSLWSLFARSAGAHADAVALDYAGSQLTYAQLRRRAEHCAAYLHARGVRTGDCVGLCLARGMDPIIAILACLRMGAAYLPLDPAYPRERLARIVAEAKPRCVLADAAGTTLLQETGALCLAMPGDDAQGDVPPPAQDAEAAAYVLYTSGSTGTPKGVAMPHRALLQLLAAQAALEPRLGQRLCTLQFTSLNFDVSFQEIFTALASGSRLLLVDEALRLDLPALVEQIRVQAVERLFIPVAVLSVLPALAGDRLPALRVVTVAGEALHIGPALRAFFGAHPDCCLVNHYGPTETHVVTAHRLPADAAQWPALPPIGRPLPNLRLSVRDARGIALPPGAIGELYVAGPALALGYLHRPDLTAERFVVDTDGEPAYRTGDRVWLAADGELHYLSRNDGQIKRRGFRIETGEIAAQLQAVAGVRMAAVDLRHDAAGEARLVAWLASDDDADTLREQARRHLAQTLPAFMQVDAIVVVDALPLTVNGKVDRARLPLPEWHGSSAAVAEAPHTPTEARLLPLWRELLGNDALGVTDNFFARGGHSLLAVRLCARIRETLGTAPPLAALFAAPSVRELAQRLEQTGFDDAGPQPGERGGRLPLSFGQARLWALAQLSRGAADYAIPALVALDGALDVERLFAAFDAVSARHDILRTRFVESDGEAAQVVHAPAREWIYTDVQEWTESACSSHIAQLVAQPFDLAVDAPIRIHLLRHTAQRHTLVVVLHHIAADAASLPLLLRDLEAAYAQPQQPTVPLRLQYGDYARWQRGRDGGAALDWWSAQLADLPTLHGLVLDHARPAQPSFAGATLEYALAPALIGQVDALAARLAVSRYVLLQAVFVVLLHHFSEDEDIVVGTPSAGRDQDGLAEMVGFFVNTLVLRHRPQPALRFDQLVEAVAATVTGALQHQETPFEHLVDRLRPARSLAHNPLFQIMFSARRGAPLQLALPGIQARALEAAGNSAKFDLSLDVNERDDGCVALWEFATDLFRPHSVRQFAEHYERLLQAVVRTPQASLAELAEVDAPPALPSPPAAMPILDRIHAQVLRSPSAIAVEDGAVQLDYATLWQRAGAVAQRLQRDGQPVAVLAPRSWQLVVAQLAAWIAGRPFVPLDPAHPAAHLQAIAADAGATALLRHADCVLDSAVADSVIGDELADVEIDAIAASDIAYLMYTSGTSGTPKGVVIGHDNLAAYVAAAGATYALAPGDRVLQLASPGFDIAIEEIVATLACGATVVVAGAEFLADAAGFCAALQRNAISVTSLPTAFWHVLAETATGAAAPGCWRLCVLGGEAVQPALLARWQQCFAAAPQLLNTYGPTETTVVASAYELDGNGRVAIGRPFGATQLRVQRNGRAVAAGLPGELLIGGPAVGRGYRGDTLRSEAAFFAAEGTRWYRSGDRVRVAGDGELEIFGRLDQQVKVQGFRVDPEQITAVLSAHPQLRQAAVVAVRTGQGDTRLAAYAVAADDGVTPALLRDWLAARLPDYMLPTAWQLLPSLPLSVNGKLDRKRLPPAQALEAPRLQAPRDEREAGLAAIWCELLRLDAVGVNDNFFSLGGNSLTAIRLKARVEARFNVAIDLAALFAQPTIAALAQSVAAGASRVAAADIGFLNNLLDELE